MRAVEAVDGSTFEVNARDVSGWLSVELVPDKREGDVYRAHADGQVVGELRFFRGFPDPDSLSIRTMGVVDSHQRRGVGSALLERLRADNPGWKIDPGTTTEQGLAFCRRILESEPVAREACWSGYAEKTTGY